MKKTLVIKGQIVGGKNQILVTRTGARIPSSLFQAFEQKATYYHSKFPGRTMKYGEVYLKDSNSVACNFLPPETIILFENTKNNKMTIGVVRDTGNLFGRQFDLSEKLMNDLDGINDGVIEVQWLAVVK